MNTNKNIVRSVMQSCVKEALSVFENKRRGDSLSDLYIKIDDESGKVEVYDDMENFLTEGILEVWSEQNDNSERNIHSLAKIAKSVLSELCKEGLFEADFIFKPFSVTLVDEHFIMIEELLFLDDENLKLDEDFLQELDKELDDFLDKLLKDFD